jgi:AraC family transcriptional regulator
MADPHLQDLSLLGPAPPGHWHGLGMHWLRTPEGRWSHRFKPSTFALAFLANGAIATRMTTRGRTVEVDLDAGDHRISETTLKSAFGFRDPELAALLRMVVLELTQGCPNGRLYGESLSLGIVLRLLRTRSTQHGAGPVERGSLGRAQLAIVDELLDGDLERDLSLASLAAEVNLSKAQFVRLFRNATGTSPHRYVMQARLRRARHLIETTITPLGEVAAMAGFSSQSHMSRAFVDTYKQTPGVARKRAIRCRVGVARLSP